MSKVKLQQVAQRAGVSVATVDRVLNRRSGVRPTTAERVKAVIRELNYQPDRLASRLARSRHYRFAFILPLGSNVFMQAIEREIAAATERCQQDHVQLTVIHTDVFDGQTLAESLDGLDDIDGLAVVALDHPAVRESIDRLVVGGVQVVTLVSDLPGSRRGRYIGIDNYAAGRTAASLVGRFSGGQSGKVGLIAGSFALRDHAERTHGFEQVLAREFRNLETLPAMEGYDNDAHAAAAAESLLTDNPELVALYSAGAGNAGIIEALQQGRQSTIFVAHELTPVNRRGLLSGTVDAVINQDAGHEVRSALRVLQALCDNRPIVSNQERIRIDIFLRDNIPPLD